MNDKQSAEPLVHAFSEEVGSALQRATRRGMALDDAAFTLLTAASAILMSISPRQEVANLFRQHARMIETGAYPRHQRGRRPH